MTSNESQNFASYLIGGIIIAIFLFSGIKGITRRFENKDLTTVHVISTNGNVFVEEISNDNFADNEKRYIGSKNVYRNGTGRNLVHYMVKYTINGKNADKPIGIIIHPDDYFLWFEEDDSYHMFTSPPMSTTIIRRGHNINSRKLDFTYLHFIDYHENISSEVTVVGN